MDGLSAFCTTNERLWRQDSEAIGEIILVDLWHDNVQYLLRSLLVSKYLERIRGGRIIGLLGDPGIVARACGTLDIPFIEKLARSYGVTEFWRPPTPSISDTTEADNLLSRIGSDLDPTSPDALQTRLAALRLPSSFPIGRFIYDTTLRAELHPTIDRVDPPLRRWTASCLAVHRWIAQKLGGLAPAFVTGHLDYNPWGLVGETVRRAGGEVFWFRLEHEVPLYRIKAAPGTLNAAYHAIEAAWFQADIAPHAKEMAPAAELFTESLRAGFFHQRWTANKAAVLPGSAAAAARAAWRRGYGWNADSTVIGIFAQAYSDQPLADEQIYADRYQWLACTIAFAAEHPERCWIVKLHPRDKAYDQTGASDALMRRFGGLAHLRFVEAPVASGAMEAVCDIGVTLFGAPGLEMALAGRPVIVAGNGPYAGCGFVHRARDRAEYQALLLAPPAALQLTPEQAGLARLYALESRAAGAPSSPLLESITTPASDPFWHLAESRLRQHAPAGDDLFEAMRRMLQDGTSRAVNPAQERYGAAGGAAWACATPRLPLLEPGPLVFSSDGAGVGCLLSGFLPPEQSGSWTTEQIACLGVRLPAPAAAGTIKLRLDYSCTVGRQRNHPGQFLSIDSPARQLLDRLPLATSGGRVFFSVRAEDLTCEHELVLALKTENICCPSEIGLSVDTRPLGLCIHSIGLSD